jgi:adenine-specific DNA-methyltransferase
MGTKRRLAPHVLRILEDIPNGVAVDAFAGMCAIAEAVAPKRRLVCNDAQLFASEVARAFFTSLKPVPSYTRVVSLIAPVMRLHASNGDAQIQKLLKREATALENNDWRTLDLVQDRIRRHNVSPKNIIARNYAGVYFSLVQALELDMIRQSIAHAVTCGAIDADEERWLLLAGAVALGKISTSTGHFAQPLGLSQQNGNRYMRQRRRSVAREFLNALSLCYPVGDAQWRKLNRVYYGDVADLFRKLREAKIKPAVVYADPPYTDDQYSRYYHVYDTWLAYQQIEVIGKGRCPTKRFVSRFCHKREAVTAFQDLFANVANTGAAVVLSYPTKGLLHDIDVEPRELLRQFFKTVRLRQVVGMQHSTMGGSKGESARPVTEVLYYAR